MKRCTKCEGGELEKIDKAVKRVVDGRAFTGIVKGTRCGKCGDEQYALSAIGAFEMAVARDLAVSAAVSGEGFQYMRKALGMRADELATLLDVARETLSRWETGEREIPRMAWALLAGIVLEGARGASPTLGRLVDFKEPPRLAKTNVAGELSAKRA